MPSLFFIALLPPPQIWDEIHAIKQYFADRYHSRAAQKSPPHITLQPPFAWEPADLGRIQAYLAEFAQQQSPQHVTLEGFGAFPPRVIYIHVCQTPGLLQLQSHLSQDLQQQLEIQISPRPFAPHLTVAFRDLSRQNFQLAWPEFQARCFNFDWEVDRLTLLHHTGRQWRVHSEFPFQAESNRDGYP